MRKINDLLELQEVAITRLRKLCLHLRCHGTPYYNELDPDERAQFAPLLTDGQSAVNLYLDFVSDALQADVPLNDSMLVHPPGLGEFQTGKPLPEPTQNELGRRVDILQAYWMRVNAKIEAGGNVKPDLASHFANLAENFTPEQKAQMAAQRERTAKAIRGSMAMLHDLAQGHNQFLASISDSVPIASTTEEIAEAVVKRFGTARHKARAKARDTSWQEAANNLWIWAQEHKRGRETRQQLCTFAGGCSPNTLAKIVGNGSNDEMRVKCPLTDRLRDWYMKPGRKAEKHIYVHLDSDVFRRFSIDKETDSTSFLDSLPSNIDDLTLMLTSDEIEMRRENWKQYYIEHKRHEEAEILDGLDEQQLRGFLSAIDEFDKKCEFP